MKIRIIDLLNKIANGEEVPKEIKFKNNIYEYRGDDYSCIFQNSKELWLFSDGYTNKTMWLGEFLNHEVEIIEEDKKIEISKITKEEFERLDKRTLLKLIVKNQNELIDVINNLKGSDN